MVLPNYNKNILNISATFSEYLGVKSDFKKLKTLDKELKKNYKNIVFIIFDGLGIYNINKLAQKNSVLKNNIKQVLTSTLPATTTNATTTMLTATSPAEHLWLAWAMYFKKQNCVSELFKSTDFYTKESTFEYNNISPINSYLSKAKSDYNISFLADKKINCPNIKKVDFVNIKHMFSRINSLCKKEQKNFLYCYCNEPDHTMHITGTKDNQITNFFEDIESSVKKLIDNQKDTLLVITADHGHIDNTEFFEINKNKDITDLLSRPISMETRFASFSIKKGNEKLFEKTFNKYYHEYFDLIKSDYLIKKGIFGPNKNYELVKEYCGDYFAVGNNKMGAFDLNGVRFKGNHASATKEEMYVPLIILKNEKKV